MPNESQGSRQDVFDKTTSKFTALAVPQQTPSIHVLNLKATNLEGSEAYLPSLEKFVRNLTKTN